MPKPAAAKQPPAPPPAEKQPAAEPSAAKPLPALRHEIKYIISAREYALVRRRLGVFMRLDENTPPPENDESPAGYHVRSLYFDDLHDRAIMDNLMGARERAKYRVRIYNFSPSRVSMEKKSRFDYHIHKTAAPLPRETFDAMLAGNYTSLRDSPEPLLREVWKQRSMALLRPAAVVDYVREAWVCGQGNTRITFDRELRAGLGGYDIFSRSLRVHPVLEKGQIVMEIKYENYLPGHVRMLLGPVTGWLVSFSKYTLCRRHLAEMRFNSRRTVRPLNG